MLYSCKKKRKQSIIPDRQPLDLGEVYPRIKLSETQTLILTLKVGHLSPRYQLVN